MSDGKSGWKKLWAGAMCHYCKRDPRENEKYWWDDGRWWVCSECAEKLDVGWPAYQGGNNILWRLGKVGERESWNGCGVKGDGTRNRNIQTHPVISEAKARKIAEQNGWGWPRQWEPVRWCIIDGGGLLRDGPDGVEHCGPHGEWKPINHVINVDREISEGEAHDHARENGIPWKWDEIPARVADNPHLPESYQENLPEGGGTYPKWGFWDTPGSAEIYKIVADDEWYYRNQDSGWRRPDPVRQDDTGGYARIPWSEYLAKYSLTRECTKEFALARGEGREPEHSEDVRKPAVGKKQLASPRWGYCGGKYVTEFYRIESDDEWYSATEASGWDKVESGQSWSSFLGDRAVKTECRLHELLTWLDERGLRMPVFDTDVWGHHAAVAEIYYAPRGVDGPCCYRNRNRGRSWSDLPRTLGEHGALYPGTVVQCSRDEALAWLKPKPVLDEETVDMIAERAAQAVMDMGFQEQPWPQHGRSKGGDRVYKADSEKMWYFRRKGWSLWIHKPPCPWSDWIRREDVIECSKEEVDGIMAGWEQERWPRWFVPTVQDSDVGYVVWFGENESITCYPGVLDLMGEGVGQNALPFSKWVRSSFREVSEEEAVARLRELRNEKTETPCDDEKQGDVEMEPTKYSKRITCPKCGYRHRTTWTNGRNPRRKISEHCGYADGLLIWKCWKCQYDFTMLPKDHPDNGQGRPGGWNPFTALGRGAAALARRTVATGAGLAAIGTVGYLACRHEPLRLWLWELVQMVM
jgi:hypothetical protein